jgi:hypothetical protein
MKRLLPRAPKAALSSALVPLIAFGPLFGAVPALAQVEVAPRVVSVGALGAAPAPLPALVSAPALTSSFGAASAPALSAAALGAAAPVLAAPAAASALAPASAIPALAAAAAPAAAASALGASALGAPAPSAAPAAATPAAKPALRGLAQALAARVVGAVAGLFDGGAPALQPAPVYARRILSAPVTGHRLKPGVSLDKKPEPPDEGAVQVSDFHVAQNHVLDNGAKPIPLDADPSDAASIETALRALVDANPQKYGAPSSEMAKVHVQYVPGDKTRGQADTYYAIFRQWVQGRDQDGSPYSLLVDGGSLTFVVKILGGKPTVMATEGSMYPGVTPDVMTVKFSDDQLLQLAEKRLQSPPDAAPNQLQKALAWVWERVAAAARGRRPAPIPPPVLVTREITNVNGTWRALNLYQASDLDGRPVIVAVDVKSGDAFAWSAQELAQSPIAGTIAARGTSLNAAGSDHGPTSPLPLPYAKVYDQSGNVVATTGADGSFTVPGSGASPVTLTARLDGQFATEADADAKNAPLSVTFTATPGQTVTPTLNATGDSEELAANVNGYVYFSKQVAWLRDVAGVTDARILAPLGGGVIANKTDMPGNAYYDPSTDSLNLEAAATVKQKDDQGKVRVLKLENTAQPSIIYHESTHRAVGILSQIWLSAQQAAAAAYRYVKYIVDPVMESGVNEAIADIVSMFMRGSPLIGEGYMTNAPAGPSNLIRTGENTTQFDAKNPDPHARGEAYMGFAWKLHEALRQAHGDDAGAAYAARLVVPTTLYSQPLDVPTAMLHVLIGDMAGDGSIPHEDVIRQSAAAHGVTLPAAPPVAP